MRTSLRVVGITGLAILAASCRSVSTPSGIPSVADRADPPELQLGPVEGSGGDGAALPEAADGLPTGSGADGSASGSGLVGPRAGNWDLSFGGSGASSNDFSGSGLELFGDIGYFVMDALEISVRQRLGFSSGVSGGSWSGSTSVAGDFYIRLEQLMPFVGASVGYLYGDDTRETFLGGPEAGVRYYLGEAAYLFGRASYEFFFDNAAGAVSNFDNGRFNYTLGFGFNF